MPFKVLCINSGLNKCVNSGRIVEVPTVGERYTVTTVCDKKYYILKELSKTIGYEAYLFIPLSNIDETEFIREQKTEPCNTSY